MAILSGTNASSGGIHKIEKNSVSVTSENAVIGCAPLFLNCNDLSKTILILDILQGNSLNSLGAYILEEELSTLSKGEHGYEIPVHFYPYTGTSSLKIVYTAIELL